VYVRGTQQTTVYEPNSPEQCITVSVPISFSVIFCLCTSSPAIAIECQTCDHDIMGSKSRLATLYQCQLSVLSVVIG